VIGSPSTVHRPPTASTPYYARLLAKLNDQESSIERLQRERDDLIARRDAARKQLDDYLANLQIG
jgi:septal ring factor EnvC (AmiA/AmiB activator)